MSEKGFTRWNELLKEVQTKKNSAERMKENNKNVFVSADQTKGSRTEPNGSVVSSENEPRKVVFTQNTEITKQITNNIRNLWEE